MLYAIFAAVLIAQREGWLSAPFMVLYAASFGAVAGVGLWQGRPHAARELQRRQPQVHCQRTTTAHSRIAAPLLYAVTSAEVLVKTTIARVE